ncbi:hypothetical protein [Halosolutus gelatinilyticus]|uniref:hypothetical protein n=1 Tax=Halosolutus gelatinilyticus TaxID=2931975 RepID=UPI001FF595F3|nr:hypothetical protein [Halosolutus gelatinilyticus]
MSERILERICEIRWIGVELLIIDAILLLLLLWSFLYVEPGTSTYYVALLSLGLIVATLLGGGALVYRCNQIQEKKLDRAD